MANPVTITPDSYTFDKNELSSLKTLLLESDKATFVTSIASPKDLLLSADSKTSGGYKYSAKAFAQLCALIAPGLALLTLDVSGQWRKTGEDTRLYSNELAIDTFNKALKLRFDHKLLGLQVVRNNKKLTIDGIVGAKYRYLANSDFLERVQQQCTRKGAKFHEALLYGRQIVIRYILDDLKYNYVIANNTYNLGYHFVNSEIGGTSVRAAPALFRNASNECLLCAYAPGIGGRVVHAGRDFDGKLSWLIDFITKKHLPSQAVLSDCGELLLSVELFPEHQEHTKRIKQLVQMLTKKHLTQTFAMRVASAAFTRGAEDILLADDMLPNDRKRIVHGRTGYDLIVSLIREARELPIDQREVAEQMAYWLLLHKNSF